MASSCLSNPVFRSRGAGPGLALPYTLACQDTFCSWKSAGQVPMCPLYREGQGSDAPASQVQQAVPSFPFLMDRFIDCLFPSQKDPQHFPIKAHVQLFDERQRTGS